MSATKKRTFNAAPSGVALGTGDGEGPKTSEAAKEPVAVSLFQKRGKARQQQPCPSIFLLALKRRHSPSGRVYTAF